MNYNTVEYHHYAAEEGDYPSTVVRYDPDGIHEAVHFTDAAPDEVLQEVECFEENARDCAECSPEAEQELEDWQHVYFEKTDEHGFVIEDWVTCEECERTWNDALETSRTPAPAGRCPFEDRHAEDGQTRYHEVWIEEAPQWFIDHFGLRGYHSTGGWRGYYETPHDLHTLAEGWFTGYPDETVSHKLTAIELREALDHGDLIPPKPLYWLTEPTSNVFSAASEVMVEPEDLEEVSEWLGAVGFPVETVDRAHR